MPSSSGCAAFFLRHCLTTPPAMRAHGPSIDRQACTAAASGCSRCEASAEVESTPPPSLPGTTTSSTGRAENAGCNAADGAQLLCRDAAALNRWAANRARGSFPTKGIGKGRAPGSEAARQAWRTFVFVCPQCSALVNRARALQQARRAGRRFLAAGDGCASARCSSDYRRLRFARSQRQVATELRSGSRGLVRPPRASDERDVRALPFQAAQVVAMSILVIRSP